MGELLYKPDWEETKKRYLAWWSCEAMDRCALAVTAPRDNAPPPVDVKFASPEERWTNLDKIAVSVDDRMARTFYGGEALPIWTVGYPGHTAIPAFAGCPTGLDWNTGWWDPILTGEELGRVPPAIDKTGRWWRFALEALRRAAAESRGKCVASLGAFGGGGDTLAALRGTERLLYDVIDRPDDVREMEERLMDQWFDVYDTFERIVREASEGSVCWFGVWSPGKTYAAQNDFSYMISPKMLRDVFLPAIERQTQFLDHTVYHVDGVGAFAHVPALCELPRLHALQILPGAGKPSPLHYMDTLKYVQSHGKGLHIYIAPEEVREALDSLSARGLYIMTYCKTEQQARELLANATKWSRDRK